MDTSDLRPGQLLAAQRKPKQGTCERCGKEFTSLARRRWCSNACKVAAYHDRVKAGSGRGEPRTDA